MCLCVVISKYLEIKMYNSIFVAFGVSVVHSLSFCVVLLCVFTFWVPCCEVHYDFRIKTMFGSYLPTVVCFIYFIWFCLPIMVSNTYCVVFFFFLRTLCCQFHWIVYLWLPLRYSFSIQSCRSCYATHHLCQRSFYKIFVKFRNSKKNVLKIVLIIVNINKDENKSLISNQFSLKNDSPPTSWRTILRR